MEGTDYAAALGAVQELAFIVSKSPVARARVTGMRVDGEFFDIEIDRGRYVPSAEMLRFIAEFRDVATD